MNDPSFAVYLDGFVDKVQSWMAAFRNVPNEDLFSGILQLVRDAVTGGNFLRVREGERSVVVKQVLEVPANCVDLALEDFDKALALLQANNLGAWRNANH
jgi:hypothetical protein